MNDENNNGNLFETLFEFPCKFPIKIMGLPNCGLEDFVRQTLEQQVHKHDSISIHVRESAGGKFISITALFEADSREQLDNLYRVFTSNPNVKMVL